MASSDLLTAIDGLSFLLAAAIAVFLPLELWRAKRAGRLRWPLIREMLASASPLLPTLVVAPIVLAYILLLYSFASDLAPWHVPITPWTALLALLLVDFCYYVDHRCAHRIRLIWAVAHSVHHSSPQYDQTTGLRVSFVDGFTSPLFYLPVVLLGFDIALVLACFGLILAWQQWLHTDMVGQLKWFDPWLNTPSNHRVHHGSQRQYLDKNYGAILMVWDQLFGSYQAEQEPVIYGLTQPINSSNPWTVHVFEAKKLWRDVVSANSFKQALLFMIKSPGWKPKH